MTSKQLVQALQNHVGMMAQHQRVRRSGVLLQMSLDTLRRLLRVDFTEDELQQLCHNLDESKRAPFIIGCEQYQCGLFGQGSLQLYSEWIIERVDEHACLTRMCQHSSHEACGEALLQEFFEDTLGGQTE